MAEHQAPLSETAHSHKLYSNAPLETSTSVAVINSTTVSDINSIPVAAPAEDAINIDVGQQVPTEGVVATPQQRRTLAGDSDLYVQVTQASPAKDAATIPIDVSSIKDETATVDSDNPVVKHPDHDAAIHSTAEGSTVGDETDIDGGETMVKDEEFGEEEIDEKTATNDVKAEVNVDDSSANDEGLLARVNGKQIPLKKNETFSPLPGKPDQLLATFRIRKPDGGEYVQYDPIPTRVADPSPNEPESFYFQPNLTTSKCPRKVRIKRGRPDVLWVEDPENDRWKRPTKTGSFQIFKPVIFFRRFHARTHQYEAAYQAEKHLKNVDPNDKAWVYSYNKWLDQINRRKNGTYTKMLLRTHWTLPELIALYTAINAFCHRIGVPNFGCGRNSGMKVAELQTIADAVNAVAKNNRNIDAVRGKIISAHRHKDGPLHDLGKEADEMRAWIEDGGVLMKDEQYPRKAIPVAEYPTAATMEASKRMKAAKISKTKKANAEAVEKAKADKHIKFEDDDSDSDLSDVPSDLEDPSLESLEDEEVDEEVTPPKKTTPKKRKYASNPADSDEETELLDTEMDLADTESEVDEVIRDDESDDRSIQHHWDSVSESSSRSSSPSSPAKRSRSAEPSSRSSSPPLKRKRSFIATKADENASSSWVAISASSRLPTPSSPAKKPRLAADVLSRTQAALGNDNGSDKSDT